MARIKEKSIKRDLLEELIGARKAKLIRYTEKKKQFYQAEAAGDLHWSVNLTQYYLKYFVKIGLLELHPTSYRTYYNFKDITFSHLLKKI